MKEDKQKHELKEYIDKLKNKEVNYQNAREIFNEVNTYNNTINIQIQNEMENYNESVSQYANIKNRPSVKDALEDSTANIPRPLFIALSDELKSSKSILSWNAIQVKLLRTINSKMARALADVRNLDIERETLSRFQKVLDKQQEFQEKQINKEFNRIEKEIDLLKHSRTQDKKEFMEYFEVFFSKYLKTELLEQAKLEFKKILGQLNQDIIKEEIVPKKPIEKKTKKKDKKEDKDPIEDEYNMVGETELEPSEEFNIDDIGDE